MILFLKQLVKSILMGPIWSLSYYVRPLKGALIQSKILRLLGVNISGLVWFESAPVILCYKNLKLGRNIAIGHGAKIICYGPISIGDGCMFGANIVINSASHRIDNLEPHIGSVIIGDRVWMGMNVAVCSGVNIGSDCVIGAGSVVLKSIPESTVAVGVPCRVMKKHVRLDRVFNVFQDVWRIGS